MQRPQRRPRFSLFHWGISMRTPRSEHRRPRKRTVRLVVAAFLLTTIHTVSATTYISVEPIPNRDVVGESNLTLMRSIGYSRLERWSDLLLSQCLAVDSVIEALTAHGAITSVRLANTRFEVAAGGFEGGTNPSFVFTVRDSGPGAESRTVNTNDGLVPPSNPPAATSKRVLASLTDVIAPCAVSASITLSTARH